MLSNIIFITVMVLTINIFLQKNNLILATTNNNQVITLGLAYDPSGVYINAYRGYQFYIQKINSMGGISLGLPGHKTNYTFELIAHSIINTTDPYWEQTNIAYNFVTKSWVWRNGQPGAPLEVDRFHAQQVRLLTVDNVDFELGGTSNQPVNETYTSSLFKKIIGLCCVGPDSVYQQQFPNNLDSTFGVQCSNAVYTQDFILTFANLGAKTIAITYTEATFPYTTCQAALNYALKQASTPYKVVYQYQFWSGMEANGLNLDNTIRNPATNKTYNLKAAVAELAAAKPDLMINCGGFNSGVYILQQLAKLGYSPKGTLQTTAPNNVQQYVAALGSTANYKYGVAQWFPTMRFKDDFFGTSPEYAAEFQAYWGVPAEYVGAGAAATAWLLATSIQEYYASRNHTPNVFNLNGILTQIKQTNVESFFGQIAFNSFIRNYAKEPGTFQLIPDPSQPYGVRQGVVFPVTFGDSVYTFPDPASVPSQSTPSSLSTGAIIGIVVGCFVFCLLLAVTAGLLYRRHRKQKKSRVTRLRLQNLPVHALIVRRASVYDLLTEIDEHRETIATKDNEGYTALQIALEEQIFTSDSITPEIMLRLFCETYELTLSTFSDEMVMSGTESQINEFFLHFQCYEWAKLVQYSSERAFLAVELILDHFPKHCKIFSRASDEHGRLVVDIASPKCKLAIQRRLWLHRRYEIKEGRPEHVSATSIVVFAIDHASDMGSDDTDTSPSAQSMSRSLSVRERLDSFKSSKNTNAVVALKFMRSYEQFHCEVTCRQKQSLSTEFVIGVVASYGMDESDPDEHAFRIDSITKGFQSYPFCLVMEAGDLTLKRIIDNQHIAGADWDEIRSITRQIATCLGHLHSRGLIHGDLKPSNVMLVGQKIKLIDLDASANISRGDFAGSKYSSGYVPPELIYESEPLSVQSPSSRSRPTSIAPSIDQSTAALLSHCQYGVRTFSIDPFGNPITTSSTHYDLVKAAVGIDMWTLGALLYFLCTGSPLFQLTVEDNIFKSDDLRLLYYWDDAFAYTLFEQVTDRYARNLISTLLNKDPSRRPDSSRVLTHPFLTGRPCARLIGEVAAYDVFLSYRVNSDAEHANRIYKSLTERGVKVWFDKKCIQPGTDWEESFIDGLLNSSCFVCLLSRNALTPVAEMTETSRADNVLLEWMLALELLERGYLSNIFPVMIGDQTTPATAINADITSVSDSSSSNTTSFNSDIEYSDYFPSGCHGSNYPTFIHPATLSKLQSHLQRQGLGQTYVNESSFAVQSVLTEMVKRQGAFIRGDWRSSVRLLVNDILSIKRARSNKVTTNTANNLDTSPSYQLSDPAADENLPEQVLGQRAESMSPPTPISPQVSHSNIANGPASRVIASPLLVENRIDNRNYTPVPTDETESIVPSTANEEERPRAATFAIEGPIE